MSAAGKAQRRRIRRRLDERANDPLLRQRAPHRARCVSCAELAQGLRL